MRTRAVALVALLLASTLLPLGAAWPGPLPTTPQPRGPIAINGDSGFTAANGVRSGTGTPADPYVISGWAIAGSATAISVKNVNSAFVIRDNLLDVNGMASAIAIENVNPGPAWIINNDVRYDNGRGLDVKLADPIVRDNAFTGPGETHSVGTAIELWKSSATVRENMISETPIGIKTRFAMPQIKDNNIGQVKTGILYEEAGAGGNVSGNIVANARDWGMRVTWSTNVTVYKNLIEHAKIGIEFLNCHTNLAHSNTIHDTHQVAVLIENCNMTLAYNVVVDGKAGIQVWDSDAILHHNVIGNFIAIGVEWMMSEGRMYSNHLWKNGYGIYLQDHEVVKLEFNTLVDNRYGLHVPYVARQSVPYMVGNLVNGQSVDGYYVPLQRAFYYKAANVNIPSGTFDSGFASGYYGATTAQGLVNFYEVDTAVVSFSYFRGGKMGVYAVNSFNVQIKSSHFVNNEIGVQFQTHDSMGTPVPACAGFVKNTTIEIDVDPPLTYGIKNLGCYMGIYDNVIKGVDVGIYFNSQATGVIAGNSVSKTSTGIWLEGDPVKQPNDVVFAHANVVAANKIGFLLRGSGADLASNLVKGNSREGVRLEVGAHPLLRFNNVTANDQGVFDAQSCFATGASCSRVPNAVGNVFHANAKNGLVVNGGGTYTKNKLIDNGARGAELRGTVVYRENVAAGNGADGAYLGSSSTVSDSVFAANGKHGLFVQGTASLRDSRMTHNKEAGIRANALWVTALKLNVSFNFDGIIMDEGVPNPTAPAVPYPYVQPAGLLPSVNSGDIYSIANAVPYVDPLFIHRSVIEGNERNAIRTAGAVVNATYNYWGTPTGPGTDTGVTGQFGNTVSPVVHRTPWYVDRAMTQTGPIAGL